MLEPLCTQTHERSTSRGTHERTSTLPLANKNIHSLTLFHTFFWSPPPFEWSLLEVSSPVERARPTGMRGLRRGTDTAKSNAVAPACKGISQWGEGGGGDDIL